MSKKSGLGNAFSWSFLDRMTTQGISTVVAIILARLIDPEHYGIISLAIIIVDLLDVFVNPGICSSLVWKKDSDEDDYSTIFVFNIIASAILYILIFTIAPVIENFYKIDLLASVIRIIALKLPFAGIISIQMAYVQKNFLFKKYFFVSLFGTLSAGVVGIVMAYGGYGVWALTAYSLLNTAMDSIVALLFIPWRPSFRFSKNRFKLLFDYGNKIFAVKLLDLIYEEISGLLIGKKYSSADLACYKKGKKFPQMIVTNVSSSMSDVLFPAFSDLQNDLAQMRLLIKKSISFSLYVILPVSFGLFACAKKFVIVLLTEKWLPCVPYIRIMCVNYVCIIVAGVLLQSIKACGRSDLLLKIEIAKKVYSVAIIVISLIVFYQPIYMAYGVVLATIISLIVDLFVAKKVLALSIVDILKDNLKTIIITTIMTVCVLLLENLPLNNILILTVQVVGGICSYVVLSIILRSKQYTDLLTLLLKRLNKANQ